MVRDVSYGAAGLQGVAGLTRVCQHSVTDWKTLSTQQVNGYLLSNQGRTNPIALRKAKLAHKFGLSECSRVNS